jgi:hypothetical protein
MGTVLGRLRLRADHCLEWRSRIANHDGLPSAASDLGCWMATTQAIMAAGMIDRKHISSMRLCGRRIATTMPGNCARKDAAAPDIQGG